MFQHSTAVLDTQTHPAYWLFTAPYYKQGYIYGITSRTWTFLDVCWQMKQSYELKHAHISKTVKRFLKHVFISAHMVCGCGTKTCQHALSADLPQLISRRNIFASFILFATTWLWMQKQLWFTFRFKYMFWTLICSDFHLVWRAVRRLLNKNEQNSLIHYCCQTLPSCRAIAEKIPHSL